MTHFSVKVCFRSEATYTVDMPIMHTIAFRCVVLGP
jgi:hypothetical protein